MAQQRGGSSRRRSGRLVGLACVAGLALLAGKGEPVVTSRVSLSSGGQQADGPSEEAAFSASGRWVAFESEATNLVSGDVNGRRDIFVRDRKKGLTTCVSVSSSGMLSDDFSSEAALSRSGRHVAFYSYASNLVEGDSNGTSDIFVHDRKTGLTTRVSLTADGGQADGGSFSAALSATGRWVAFESQATNLVPGDDNGVNDIFVHDRKTGLTTRVSVDSAGVQGNGHSVRPALSANGRWVAFRSAATNLVAGDTNAVLDVFVHDRKTGLTTRVSVDSAGGQADQASIAPVLSANGRHVAFSSDASNLVEGDSNGASDVFVHDRKTGSTTRVSLGAEGVQGDGASIQPALSASGRVVAFVSKAANLVPGADSGTWDIFVRDRKKGLTVQASLGPSGLGGDGDAFRPALQARGRAVAFDAAAGDLVADDSNGVSDVFVRGLP